MYMSLIVSVTVENYILSLHNELVRMFTDQVGVISDGGGCALEDAKSAVGGGVPAGAECLEALRRKSSGQPCQHLSLILRLVCCSNHLYKFYQSVNFRRYLSSSITVTTNKKAFDSYVL